MIMETQEVSLILHIKLLVGGDAEVKKGHNIMDASCVYPDLVFHKKLGLCWIAVVSIVV